MSNVPLCILDLVPISSGSNAGEALRNSIDLAQQAERFGYHRYWFAEHHLNPGVAGTSTAVVIAIVAGATSTIRIGSGAVQLGHRTPLSVVEEFGLIDALYPGRIDLGLGRSAGRPTKTEAPVGASRPPRPKSVGASPVVDGRTANGLRIPAPYSFEHLLGSPRVAMQRSLLQQPEATSPSYSVQIGEILDLLAGTYCSAGGVEAHVVPGEHAAVEIWILGSSGGVSAEVAGERSLRFAASYHITPATALEGVDSYRAAFRPSPVLPRPYVSVSADVVVAEDERRARDLAEGYALWVRSIRTGEGAIPFPSASEARAHAWTDKERALVTDRIETQFVGSPAQVADQLETLQEATAADELIVTTITHDHRDRVRSYELLAEEWGRR